jgi:hypothetical protein
MLNKLKALGLILGFISPVADLIRAIAAVREQAPRIAEELAKTFRTEVGLLFQSLRLDIDREIDTEPSLQALKSAMSALQAKIAAASKQVQGPRSKVQGLLLLSVLCASVVNCSAQGPAQFVAAGANFNQYSAPQISGSLLYAHRVAGDTFSFSLVDITSKTVRPFTVQTAISTGVAQHLVDVGRGHVYAVTTVGLAAGAENVGGAWTGGGAVIVPLGARGWAVIFSARTLKTSLAGWQGMYGLGVGWGK